jgi:hypothetical protein
VYDLAAVVPASALAGVVGPAAPINLDGQPAGGLGLQIEGMFRVSGEATAVGGVAVVSFGPVPQGRLWLLQRYVVSATPAVGAACSLYLDQVATPFLEDGTISGDLDVADGDPPILVPSGSVILFAWAGAATSRCYARVQYAQAYLGG